MKMKRQHFCPSSRRRSTANQWNHNHNTNNIEKIGKTIDWLFNRNWVKHFFPQTFPETISPRRLVCLSRFLRLVFRQAELSFCWTTLKLVSFSFHVSFNRCLIVGVPFSRGFLRPTPSNFFWYLQKEPQKAHHLQWKVWQIKEWMAVIICYLFLRLRVVSLFVLCRSDLNKYLASGQVYLIFLRRLVMLSAVVFTECLVRRKLVNTTFRSCIRGLCNDDRFMRRSSFLRYSLNSTS